LITEGPRMAETRAASVAACRGAGGTGASEWD